MKVIVAMASIGIAGTAKKFGKPIKGNNFEVVKRIEGQSENY